MDNNHQFLQWLDELEDQVMERARAGIPAHEWASEADVNTLVSAVSNPAEYEARSRLVGMLGYVGGPKHRQIIEPFLRGPDWALARDTIYVLCSQWRLHHFYIGELAMFIRGVDWDYLWECQRMAIYMADEYLQRHEDARLLVELTNLSNDPDADAEPRSAAQGALRNIEASRSLWNQRPHD
jgi:hypothetical protein